MDINSGDYFITRSFPEFYLILNLSFYRGHPKDTITGQQNDEYPAEQHYSEQSTLRIGESLSKPEQPMPSQQSQRRRRHSGSIPDATTALSMMGGSSGSERLSYNADALNSSLSGGNHRHRSLSDSRSNNPRNNGRGKL